MWHQESLKKHYLIYIFIFITQVCFAQNKYDTEINFGLKLDSLLLHEDIVEIDSLFNRKIFLNRLKRNLKTTAHAKHSSVDSLVMYLKFSDFLLKTDSIGEKSPLEFVHIHTQNGSSLLRFRDLSLNTPVNYVDFMIRKKDSSYELIDFYNHSHGMWFSEEIEQTLIGENLISLTDWHHELWFTDLYRLRTLVVEQDYQGALTFYTLLPNDIKKHTSFLLLALQANVYRPYYKEAMLLKWSEKYFSDLPAHTITKIHLADVRKDYKMLIQELNNLEMQIGKDPYLALLMADAHFKDDNYTEGKRICQLLVTNDIFAFEASLLLYQYAFLLKEEADANEMAQKLLNVYNYQVEQKIN